MSTETKPKFEHNYPYQCTFLGTSQLGPNVRDMYHTKTFDGIMLLTRYGNGLLEFTGEKIDWCKHDRNDPDSFNGEAYRAAEKMGLQLVNDPTTHDVVDIYTNTKNETEKLKYK